MTLADLPVLNPSTPGRERGRAAIVAALFAVFGTLYALGRAAAAAPPDISASTDPVFGFAFPREWGIAQALWSGAATWPARLAAADVGTTLAVSSVVILAIALVVVMHPDILSREGPQYVSPARRITTVAIAFLVAFLMYYVVGRIDDLFATSTAEISPGRRLIGYAALFAILFGGVWSFIGPKDFGRRIPLRISHGALGGLGVWAAITFATILSNQPRSFLSSSLDTFYTLLTLDAAHGGAGATAGWAMSSDVLTAAVAMAVAGSLLVVTAPQSLGPGNRRGGAVVAGVLGLFLAVVALTAWTNTTERAAAVAYDVVSALALDGAAPPRVALLLGGPGKPESERPFRWPSVPTLATADDCVHGGPDRGLPAATAANVQKLTAWLSAHGREVSGPAIRVASCRAALLALRWEVEAAREGIFLTDRPERIGPLTYYLAAPNVASAGPLALRRILAALADTSRFQHGAEAAQRFADLARVAGDAAAETAWRQRIIQPTTPAMSMLLARPAYTDGVVGGRLVSTRPGWRLGLLSAPDPTSGGEEMISAPRAEGAVLSLMVSAADVGRDGRFSFTGLRDGYYVLALLGPEGSGSEAMTNLQVRGDPGVFQLEPARKAKDLGTITVNY